MSDDGEEAGDYEAGRPIVSAPSILPASPIVSFMSDFALVGSWCAGWVGRRGGIWFGMWAGSVS